MLARPTKQTNSRVIRFLGINLSTELRPVTTYTHSRDLHNMANHRLCLMIKRAALILSLLDRKHDGRSF